MRVETGEDVRVATILRVLESQVCRTAEDEEAEDIKEQIRKALQWVAGGKEGDQPRWIIPLDREEETIKEALARARRILKDAKQQVLEAGEAPEGEGQGRCRGLGRARGGQMQLVVENQDRDGQGDGEGGHTKEAGGGGLGQEEDSLVGYVGGSEGEIAEGVEGATEDGGHGNGSGEGMSGGEKDNRGVVGDSSAGDRGKRQQQEEEIYERQEGEDELEQGADSGRPKRRRTKGLRCSEEGRDEPGRVEQGANLYGPHKVRGTWTVYLGTVKEVIVQKGNAEHETRAATVQWEDQDDGDNERLPYQEARLRVCPKGSETEIQGHLGPEHEVKELEGTEVSSRRRNRKNK